METNFYPTIKEYDKYWKGQKKRAQARVKDSISPLFTTARDRITTDMLSVLNNRRYLAISDLRKRMIAVKRDPKIKQVEEIIISVNNKSLMEIYKNQEAHYKEEVPNVCDDIYPWSPFSCKADPLSNKEINDLKLTPFLGSTFKEWIDNNSADAVKQWNNKFRSIMIGDIRSATAVSRDVQLVQSARNILNTNESRNSTIFENAMIEVSRKAQADVQGAIWPSL